MISLIVPIYNEAPFLPRCLDSIANQTIPFDEVILIDDASDDGSLQIAHNYAYANQWRLIENTRNKGVGHARNQGIEAAAGEYITFLDSDDALNTSAHEAMLNAIEAHPEAEIIQFDHTRIVFGPHPAAPNKPGFYDLRKGSNGLPTFWAYVWNKIYKRELVKDQRFCGIQFGEDEAFNLELFLNDAKFYYDGGETVVKYFDNAFSLAHQKKLADLKAQDDCLKELQARYTEKWQQDAIAQIRAEHHASKTYKTKGWT